MVNEWDDVRDTNNNMYEAWMYPHRNLINFESPRVWAVQAKHGGKCYIILKPAEGYDRERIDIDTTDINEAKATALALFRMR
jgi:hypothetical protein